MKLWLWKNFVDGKPEYWAFDNPFPVHLDCGDPQTIGEPCGYATFKESRVGRTDVPEAEVLRRIAATLAASAATVRAPLTDAQLRDALRTCKPDVVEALRVRWLYTKDFARAIEQAHGIGKPEPTDGSAV